MNGKTEKKDFFSSDDFQNLATPSSKGSLFIYLVACGSK